jgi:hypothetical protein
MMYPRSTGGSVRGVSEGKLSTMVHSGRLGDNVFVREVGTLTTNGAPINQTSGASGTEIMHDIICCLKMNLRGAFIKLSEDRYCRGYVETSNLDCENQHAGECAILKTELFVEGELGGWFQRASRHLKRFENGRGE